MNRSAHLIEFLGLRRSMVGAMLLVVLVGLGERIGERFLPIYLLALGGGALSVGVLQALTNLLGALYSYPGGYLADRIGIKRALLVFNVMAIAGFLAVVAVPAWPAVLAGSLLFLSWSAISLLAMMNLVAVALPATQRTMGVALHSFVRRFPMAVGPGWPASATPTATTGTRGRWTAAWMDVVSMFRPRARLATTLHSATEKNSTLTDNVGLQMKHARPAPFARRLPDCADRRASNGRESNLVRQSWGALPPAGLMQTDIRSWAMSGRPP